MIGFSSQLGKAILGRFQLGNVSSGAAVDSGTLTGAGTLSGSGIITVFGSGTLTGAGTLSGTSGISVFGAGTLTGDGTLAGTVSGNVFGIGTLTGSGTLWAASASGDTFPPDGAITADARNVGVIHYTMPVGIITRVDTYEAGFYSGQPLRSPVRVS